MKRILFCLSFFTPWFLFGQLTKAKVTENLPSHLKYEFSTDEFDKLAWNKRSRKWNGKEKIGDSLKLGCSRFEKNGVPIAFQLTIYQKNKREEYPFRLYAVKRVDYQWDEEVINALDYYCYYGQANYYFMSKEYILFTYAVAGDAFAMNNQDLMVKIENQLVKNLNGL